MQAPIPKRGEGYFVFLMFYLSAILMNFFFMLHFQLYPTNLPFRGWG
jgi:hypothetical protein